MYDLISIGSVVKDIIVLTDRGKIFKTPKDKLAPVWLGFELGEKIRIDEAIQSLGGVAADISLGLKNMKLNILPYSTIGNDSNGQWLIQELKKEKTNTSAIALENTRRTPFNILLVDKKSGERVIFSQKSSGELDLSRLEKFKAKYLYVSSLKGSAKKQTDIILNYLKKNNAELIVSPSTSQIRDDFADLKKLLKFAKILILNRNEALEIMAQSRKKAGNINYVINYLHKLGPEIVCVTDGTKGAWASDGKNVLHNPIKKVKTVDVTGAGDAFAAGFLGVFLRGVGDAYMRPEKKAAYTRPLLAKSLRAGIINSASVVQYIGTTKGLLTKKEITKKF